MARSILLKISIALIYVFLTVGCLQAAEKAAKNKAKDDCMNNHDVINKEYCYKVCSDLHIYEEGLDDDSDIYKVESDTKLLKRTFYIGDIFDLENALQDTADENEKKAVRETITREINKLKETIGDHYIRGNHELDACENCPIQKIVNGILFTHGHYICGHPDKINYWESGKNDEQKKGCYKGRKCNIDCFDNAKELAIKHPKVHTIVFGHKHPLRKKTKLITIEREVNGNKILDTITIINVKKGCSYLKLPISEQANGSVDI